MKNILGSILLLSAFSSASAAFILVENFNGLNVGNLSGQGNWSGTSPGITIVDNSGDKQMLTSAVNNTYIHNAAGTPDLSNNTTGTLFLQFTTGATLVGNDFGFGFSDVAAPTTFGDWESHFSINSTGIAVRNGGTFSTRQALAVSTTYNVWLVADNTTDTSTLYLQGGTGAFATQTIAGTGTFRNGTASNPLVSLLGIAGSGNTAGSLLFDNIYVDTAGVNLANPSAIPEPSTFSLLALTMALVGVVQRRWSRA